MNNMFLFIQTLKPIIIISFPLVYVATLIIIDKILVRGISNETLREWHTNPAYWRSDAIYSNPADPRLFPPKKLKAMGWTINTANPWSVASLIFLVTMIIAAAVFL